jgi:hypothetical protein
MFAKATREDRFDSGKVEFLSHKHFNDEITELLVEENCLENPSLSVADYAGKFD